MNEQKKIGIETKLIFLLFTVILILSASSIKMYINYSEQMSAVESERNSLRNILDTVYLQVENKQNLIVSTEEQNRILQSEIKIISQEYNLSLDRIRMLETRYLSSPYKRVSDDRIIIENNSVLIRIDSPYTSTFSNTNSMMPLLSETSRAIQIIPKTPDELFPGDVISYSLNGRTVIHRIILIGEDNDGWYAITKGDNNINPDPQIVRFSQVRRVLIAVIY